eukprot:6053473-Prymnesium_polylepis.1
MASSARPHSQSLRSRIVHTYVASSCSSVRCAVLPIISARSARFGASTFCCSDRQVGSPPRIEPSSATSTLALLAVWRWALLGGWALLGMCVKVAESVALLLYAILFSQYRFTCTWGRPADFGTGFRRPNEID